VRLARAAALAAIPLVVLGPAASALAQSERHAFLFLVEGLTFERALADPSTGALARAGGIGLMTNADPLEVESLPGLSVGTIAPDRPEGFEGMLAEIEGPILVIVAGTASDEGVATPIVVARGESSEMLDARGEPAGVT
jgi:hypothetical protein